MILNLLFNVWLALWALNFGLASEELPTPQPTSLDCKGKKYALIFALADYGQRGQAWTPLQHPIENGRKMASLLSTMYDFKVDLIINANGAQIRQKFAEYQNKTYGENDQLLIYYLGHGAESPQKDGYLVPIDGSSPNAGSYYLNTLIPLTQIRDYVLNMNNCRHVLLMLDACFSGHILDATGPRQQFGSGERWIKEAWVCNYLKYPSKLCISSSNAYAYDDSNFTNKFLEVLNNNNTPGESLTFTGLWSYLEKTYPLPVRGSFIEADLYKQDFLFTRNNYAGKDSDGDTTPDHLDKCPTIAGEPRFGGCQDRDKDGIPDPIDYCPDEYGPGNGCPRGSISEEPSPPPPPRMAFLRGSVYEIGKTVPRDDRPASPTKTEVVQNLFISKYEVTFKEFDAFCRDTKRPEPSDYGWGRGDRPVIGIDWYDAVQYCNWKSEQEGLPKVYNLNTNNWSDDQNFNPQDSKRWKVHIDHSAKGYRLLTEAEWEYAAREGGRVILYGNGKSIASGNEINFDNQNQHCPSPYCLPTLLETRKMTLPVGSFKPNALGLFDMSGNVAEWCEDWYVPYVQNPAENRNFGSQRVYRGGSWFSTYDGCMTTNRSGFSASFKNDMIGFRIARRVD